VVQEFQIGAAGWSHGIGVNRIVLMKRLGRAAVALVATSAVVLPVAVLASTGATRQETDLALIISTMLLVERAYVHPVDESDLTKQALKGMLSSLDPHSDYMDEKEFKDAQSDLAGQFGGLGLEISDGGDGIPKVIAPVDGTPASRAGLQPGDLILAIDGKSTKSVAQTTIISNLRGTPGSKVKIRISRGNVTPFDVTLTREIIHVPNVRAAAEPNGMLYVRVSEFGDDTATEFGKAISDFSAKTGDHPNGLVLDLRNNPGGLLTTAVSVAGSLLDGGSVVTIRGRTASDQQTFRAPANGDVLRGVPIVVLINGASASAAEIVAGALQDRHRATLLGTASFGKGSVQTVIPIQGHGALRLTTALYYTPAGRSIQGRGIAPDVVVSAPKDEQTPNWTLGHESDLRGAIDNPGAADKTDRSPASASPEDVAASAPIRPELIGTTQDAQLNAALAHLAKMRRPTTAQNIRPQQNLRPQ
jgi:carboxyl-terminal processing protease